MTLPVAESLQRIYTREMIPKYLWGIYIRKVYIKRNLTRR